jgi:rhomboid family protein
MEKLSRMGFSGTSGSSRRAIPSLPQQGSSEKPQLRAALPLHRRAKMSDPSTRQRQPILNVPPITRALMIINIAVHAVRSFLLSDVDADLVRILAFVPARYTAGQLGWPALIDPISYQFIHANLTHLGVNMLALLAFGSGIERRVGGWRMLAFTIICGVLAALTHLAIYPTSAAPVIGASGAISGLFGGVLRMQTSALSGQRTGLWPLVILWIIVTVIAGQTGMPGDLHAPIAWIAHLGGFLAGLLLFGFFHRPLTPGGS